MFRMQDECKCAARKVLLQLLLPVVFDCCISQLGRSNIAGRVSYQSGCGNLLMLSGASDFACVAGVGVSVSTACDNVKRVTCGHRGSMW